MNEPAERISSVRPVPFGIVALADLTFLLSHGCPVIRDNVSRFLDTGSPEGKHFFVRPFVIAGKIPVAGIFGVRLSLTI